MLPHKGASVWVYIFGKFSSLSSLKGGEGRGDEAKTDAKPLTPTLSPFGRGEGVEAAAMMKACQRNYPAKVTEIVFLSVLCIFAAMVVVVFHNTVLRIFALSVSSGGRESAHASPVGN